jgi:hypothetical protein
MRYHVHWHRRGHRPFKPPSTVITCDGVVVYTTPAMAWSLGKSISYLDEWCINKRLRLALVVQEFKPPFDINVTVGDLSQISVDA